MIVLCILFIEAIVFFGITFKFLQEEPVYAWFFGMFVVATCIPPLLPTVFVVSVGISAERLLRKRIAVTDNARILVAGKVQVAFFDKTGTLTKQGLGFQVARAYKDGTFDDLVKPSGVLGMGMTVCHTLTESSNGAIVGHLLERIMFEETGASFSSNAKNKVQIKTLEGKILYVLKRFEFDYTSQTQSVLVEDDKGKHYVFAKGSVEAIKKICLESTMPHDIDEVSAHSSREGIYQIAFAMSEISEEESKDLSLSSDESLARLPKERLETDLTFIGFIDFINTMKDETPGALKILEEGDIRTFMLTGDSVLTGIHIARKGGMIDPAALVVLGKDIDQSGNVLWVDSITSKPMDLPSIAELKSQKSKMALAVTGKVWSHMLETDEDLARDLAYYIRVHGRCTPHDKVSVVSYFVKMGFMTLMCGDGGNDCGALKTAHVGIALSDAEASVVSPFTSMDKSIESVVEVLKEGRCALCSAIASYKYMIMYGQVETINQVICAWFATTPGDWNWIFMDGIWVIIMAFTLPLAKTAKTLAPSRPTSSLLGPHTMSSTLGILGINFAFVALSLWLLYQQDWFQCRKWDGGKGLANLSYICDNYETSVIFVVSGYQYINSAVPYNFGFVYRANWIKNYIFVFFVVAFTLLHFYATLVPGSVSCLFRLNCVNENVVPDPFGEMISIQNSFNTTIMPVSFRYILVAIIIANLVANVVWEYFVVNGDYSLWKMYKNRKE
jgi:predicted P-type ATPase